MSNKLLNETEGKVPGRKCPPIYFIPRARKWCHLHFFETHDHQHFSPAARMALSHTDHMQAQCLETGMPFGWALLGESLAFCPALNIQKLLTNQERFSSPNSVWHLWFFFCVTSICPPPQIKGLYLKQFQMGSCWYNWNTIFPVKLRYMLMNSLRHIFEVTVQMLSGDLRTPESMWAPQLSFSSLGQPSWWTAHQVSPGTQALELLMLSLSTKEFNTEGQVL